MDPHHQETVEASNFILPLVVRTRTNLQLMESLGRHVSMYWLWTRLIVDTKECNRILYEMSSTTWDYDILRILPDANKAEIVCRVAKYLRLVSNQLPWKYDGAAFDL